MILVDSSVWIDYFGGRVTLQTEFLNSALLEGKAVLGDLIMVEVLQGIRDDRQFEQVRSAFAPLSKITVCSPRRAEQAARHYRTLRAQGVTVRKTIDTLIATRCIADGIPLLFSDRDFQLFVDHLGLVDAMALASSE